MRRGRLVVLEGLDGAGTTTQVDRLASALRAEGRAVLTTREPSDGPVGVMIRQALTGRLGLPGGRGPLSPQTLALLFAADRQDHLAARVLPALERGELVLSDRYLLSSLAYQGAQLSMKWVEEINRFALAPDLTLFLEVGASTAARRRGARGGDAELYEREALQRKIRRQYQQAIARRRRRERIVSLDGEQGVEEVSAQALAAIRKVLPRQSRRPDLEVDYAHDSTRGGGGDHRE